MSEHQGNGKAQDAPPLTQSKSTLVVEWEFVGAASFKIAYENVNPLQRLALAEWLKIGAQLEIEAGMVAAAQQQAVSKPQIMVPGMRLQ
jgi:hypothetical protein